MALSKNKPRTFGSSSARILPDRLKGIDAATQIYEGSYLTMDAADGSVKPAVGTEEFAGVALQKKLGGAAANDEKVLIRREGLVLDNVAGANDATFENDIVYANNDDALTLTSTSNSPMGHVEEYVGPGTLCWVRFAVPVLNSTS